MNSSIRIPALVEMHEKNENDTRKAYHLNSPIVHCSNWRPRESLLRVLWNRAKFWRDWTLYQSTLTDNKSFPIKFILQIRPKNRVVWLFQPHRIYQKSRTAITWLTPQKLTAPGYNFSNIKTKKYIKSWIIYFWAINIQ